MKRYASIIALNPGKEARYLELHGAVWPEVNAMISACNIRNFSIFMREMPDGVKYLFMYFEYHGADYQADMDKMAADPATQKWWEECKPCQVPLPNRAEGEWWAAMEEVCHHD
jgi:L-rhamnose mutarotase